MRKPYLLLALFLLPVIAIAQQNTVSDIQGWILSHLGTQASISSFDDKGRPVRTTVGTNLSFNNCTASVNQDMAMTMTYDAILPQREVILTTHDHTTFSLNLATAQPGKINVVQYPSRPGVTNTQVMLNIPLRTPTPQTTTSEVATRGGSVKPGDTTTGQWNVVGIVFSDSALAQRQAAAWRDLITACGGKDISDNLY